MPNGPLWILEATYSSFQCLLQPIFQKADTSVRGPEQERTLQQAHTAAQVALSVGTHDAADPMALVSEVDREAVWGLFQALIVETHHGPSGFWSPALPSFLDNYYLFERQLLTCYWALAESEY